MNERRMKKEPLYKEPPRSASLTEVTPGASDRVESTLPSRLPTGTVGYRVWWISLLVLHGLNVTYYIMVAVLYHKIDRTFLWYKLRALTIGISDHEYPKVSKIHATIAAIHGVFMLLMIGGSLMARRLVFYPRMKSVFTSLHRIPCLGQLLSVLCGVRPLSQVTSLSNRRTFSTDVLHGASKSVSHQLSQIFGRDGLLGVDSVHFDRVLLAREVTETALQVYQLYRMTQTLSRVRLTRVYAILLIANCWSIPILHTVYRHRPAQRRILCLLFDAVLDMVSSIGVSLMIFITYFKDYDSPEGHAFGYVTWFNDKWLATMHHEFQVMLVVSWGDMASRLVFACGLLECMNSIKDMLTPVGSPARTAGSTHQIASPNRVAPSANMSEAVPSKQHSTSPQVLAHSERTHHAQSWWKRVASLLERYGGPVLFFVVGCVLVAIHCAAEAVGSMCDQPLKPWFSTKPACSLVELNCHTLGSNGSDEALAQAWDAFDAQQAVRVVIRHCPQLVISSEIQAYTHMAGFKIYNSSIVAWGQDGALNAANHDSMRSLTIVRTTFPHGELPLGLQAINFPALLKVVMLCVTNIATLPTDLDTKWPRHIDVMLEFARLSTLPEVVLRLQPIAVSLAGTPVVSVPASLFQTPGLTAVNLSKTRIQGLPRYVLNPSSLLTLLKLQSTNVSTFGAWLDRYAHRNTQLATKLFYGFDTPYCRELSEITAGNRTQFSASWTSPDSPAAIIMDVSTPAKLAYAQAAIDCKPTNPTSFPLPYEDALHRLR